MLSLRAPVGSNSWLDLKGLRKPRNGWWVDTRHGNGCLIGPSSPYPVVIRKQRPQLSGRLLERVHEPGLHAAARPLIRNQLCHEDSDQAEICSKMPGHQSKLVDKRLILCE